MGIIFLYLQQDISKQRNLQTDRQIFKKKMSYQDIFDLKNVSREVSKYVENICFLHFIMFFDLKTNPVPEVLTICSCHIPRFTFPLKLTSLSTK